MATPDILNLPDDDLLERDGAACVQLSKTITAVLDALDQCTGDLAGLRYHLRQKGHYEELSVGEPDPPRPVEQARHIAGRLEECARALRNASGEVGDRLD